jgi:SPASM domain peptide maturase of grasp-with-spasm system
VAHEPAASAFVLGRVFRLYPSCKLVKGGAYSAIYDLDRRMLFRFDSAYLPLFERAEAGITSDEMDGLDPGPRARCIEVIAYLEEREVGRYLDAASAALLAPLPERWDSPHTILSAIVDVADQEPEWEALVGQLDGLQTRSLQVRCFAGLIGREGATRLLARMLGTRITRIELVLKWASEWDRQDWRQLFHQFENLQRVRLHSAPRDLDISGDEVSDLPRRLVRFERKIIDGAAHCGAIAEGSLATPSAALYSELRSFNGCLNRKVSIRADGQICNCPSLRATYGSDVRRLSEIVKSHAFQRPWAIAKDRISVCSGCEFRYVCTDCRAYLGDDLSTEKPARCRYDPLTGRWAA